MGEKRPFKAPTKTFIANSDVRNGEIYDSAARYAEFILRRKRYRFSSLLCNIIAEVAINQMESRS